MKIIEKADGSLQYELTLQIGGEQGTVIYVPKAEAELRNTLRDCIPCRDGDVDMEEVRQFLCYTMEKCPNTSCDDCAGGNLHIEDESNHYKLNLLAHHIISNIKEEDTDGW